MDIVDGGKRDLLCLYHQRHPLLLMIESILGPAMITNIHSPIGSQPPSIFDGSLGSPTHCQIDSVAFARHIT